MKTNFEKLKSMSAEELAEWLNTNGMWDNSPWYLWWDRKYCQNCEDVREEYEADGRYAIMCRAWCEIYDKCRFFPDHDDVPDCKEIVKMWLESEVEDV
jgi:hypothetical protein